MIYTSIAALCNPAIRYSYAVITTVAAALNRRVEILQLVDTVVDKANILINNMVNISSLISPFIRKNNTITKSINTLIIISCTLASGMYGLAQANAIAHLYDFETSFNMTFFIILTNMQK